MAFGQESRPAPDTCGESSGDIWPDGLCSLLISVTSHWTNPPEAPGPRQGGQAGGGLRAGGLGSGKEGRATSRMAAGGDQAALKRLRWKRPQDLFSHTGVSWVHPPPVHMPAHLLSALSPGSDPPSSAPRQSETPRRSWLLPSEGCWAPGNP